MLPKRPTPQDLRQARARSARSATRATPSGFHQASVEVGRETLCAYGMRPPNPTVDHIVGIRLEAHAVTTHYTHGDSTLHSVSAASAQINFEATMSDDTTQSGGQDRTRISLGEDYEVRDWAKKFGVTPQELRDAVAAVGDQAAAVEAHLKGQAR